MFEDRGLLSMYITALLIYICMMTIPALSIKVARSKVWPPARFRCYAWYWAWMTTFA